MMRYFCSLLIPAALCAQSASTTYQTDVNGHRTAVASVDQNAKGERTERLQSLNGRRVPLEQSTEKVLRDDAGGKIVERTIQKFDASGRPAGTEKVLVEETPLPGGGKTVRETRSQSDLNGRFAPVERRVSETRVSGQTTTTSVSVDRPTPNQTFQTMEKRTTVTTGPQEKQTSTESVDRPDLTGRFRTVQRIETNVQAVGDKTTQNTATYDVNGLGAMVLNKQTVATTTKLPGGGETTETNVYSAASMGKAQAGTDKMQIQEQRVTERQVADDGTVTDVVSLRTPNPSDPKRLGDLKKVSETVCTGKCLPPAPAPAKP